MICQMVIETNDLKLEIEPELLTDEHVERIKALIELTLEYERRKEEVKLKTLIAAHKLEKNKK